MSLTSFATRSSGLSRETRSTLTRDLLSQLSDPSCSRREIEDEIIRINLVVAMQVARRYEGRGIEADDLRQVASLGLVKAVRAYDPDKATDFLSFAVPTIRGEVRRWFRDRGWMVRPPRSVQEIQADISARQRDPRPGAGPCRATERAGGPPRRGRRARSSRHCRPAGSSVSTRWTRSGRRTSRRTTDWRTSRPAMSAPRPAWCSVRSSGSSRRASAASWSFASSRARARPRSARSSA